VRPETNCYREGLLIVAVSPLPLIEVRRRSCCLAAALRDTARAGYLISLLSRDPWLFRGPDPGVDFPRNHLKFSHKCWNYRQCITVNYFCRTYVGSEPVSFVEFALFLSRQLSIVSEIVSRFHLIESPIR